MDPPFPCDIPDCRPVKAVIQEAWSAPVQLSKRGRANCRLTHELGKDSDDGSSSEDREGVASVRGDDSVVLIDRRLHSNGNGLLLITNSTSTRVRSRRGQLGSRPLSKNGPRPPPMGRLSSASRPPRRAKRAWTALTRCESLFREGVDVPAQWPSGRTLGSPLPCRGCRQPSPFVAFASCWCTSQSASSWSPQPRSREPRIGSQRTWQGRRDASDRRGGTERRSAQLVRVQPARLG
jgi:hypothetical protein